MIVDLHAHYPMHLEPDGWHRTLSAMTNPDRDRLRDVIRARILEFVSYFLDYAKPWSGPAVTVESLRAGGVGVALSVLYSPFDEMDVRERYGAPPAEGYFETLKRQMDLVEKRIADRHANEAGIPKSVAELDALLAAGKLALVHAVEGGFHLGATSDEIRDNVEYLGDKGIAYITVAHLFFRQIASNAPALPFLPDTAYKVLFPQDPVGLTALGEALVRAMVARGILVDVTHMDGSSLSETFALLDQIDPARSVPVVASHIACRFGKLEYNLDDATILRIAERKGVLGVILCDHYACDGIRKDTDTFAQSMDVIEKQIDRIVSITGSSDFAAIGTDLDGFIKPTLHGLDNAKHLKALEAALVQRYGEATADKICSENALRVLRNHWLKRHP